MSLEGNNNTSPRKTLKRADLKSIIKEMVGEVRAELIDDNRQQELDALDNPTAPASRAAAVGQHGSDGGSGPGTIANIRRSIRDPLANKDIGDMTSNEKALMFARWVQCCFQAKEAGSGHTGAIEIAQRAGQMTLVKAMEASDFDQGGFLLEPVFADSVIEELVARSVYTRAGPMEVDLPEGGLVLPFEDDGADAQWAGEGASVNAEQITGGQIRMQPFKLITIVGVSNDLLRAQPGRSDRFILDSILRGMRVKLDSTLLRGVGTANEPAGLLGLVAAANKFDVTSKTAITQAILVREVLKLQNLIETANVDLETDRPHYFTAPRIKNYLKSQRATDGILFPGLEAVSGSQRLLGVPLSSTTNIPTNLDESATGSNDESEMYCVALAHMILGRTVDMQIDVFPGGTYVDTAGNTVSGVTLDRTPVRVLGKWDHAAGQRGNEIALAQELDWAL